jgi:hypothetical protein
MSELLDRLKDGLADAQKRQAESLKRFQAVQVEYNIVTAEVTGYQKVLELETRKELEKAAATPPVIGPQQQSEQQVERELNKTELVRSALAEHPGLTPAQLWGALRNQMGRRNYLYSILKRLKDRKQILEKRGKYYLPPTPKIEEGHEQQTLQ